MISCKKAGELIEKKSIAKLSLMERFQLSTHTGICKLCAHYKKISQIIDRKLKENENTKLEVNKKLPDAVKSRIFDSISK